MYLAPNFPIGRAAISRGRMHRPAVIDARRVRGDALMTTLAAEGLRIPRADQYASTVIPGQISIALLGLGQVGKAVATAALHSDHARTPMRITGALVRDTARVRTGSPLDTVAVTTEPAALLEAAPDVVVEALGGLEPARTLVVEALLRGIPVVTANKSLLAEHGDELFAASARSGAPLRYEATVIAGVPFLGTFSRRPLAATVTKVVGVVNGTTNFILSRLGADCANYADALREAQHCGFAEPDANRDVRGMDSADKLCVLLRHFGRRSVRPCDVETSGIENLTADDLRCAAEFGGAIRPVVFADWSRSPPLAFTGPAFLRARHRLAAVSGVQNAIVLSGGPAGDLVYAGAGAGPAATAATILDDVVEALADYRSGRSAAIAGTRPAVLPEAPETAWFVRISGRRLPEASEVADLFGAYGIWQQRGSETVARAEMQTRWLLTYPCSRGRIERALHRLSAAADCTTLHIRALED
jgi:homoserine dehydrogenase